MRLWRPILATSVLLLIISGSVAETPVFVGQVIGDRANGFDTTVLQNYLGDTASSEIGAEASRIAKNVIDRLDSHPEFTHFARPVDVYAELPDDMLLMVLAIEGSDEDIWQTATLGDLKTIVSAVSLQLVDPRTGQVAYSDFEVLNSDHHTTIEGDLIPLGHIIPAAERGYYIPDGNGLLVPDRSGGTRVASRASMHMNLASHVVRRLIDRMLTRFVAAPAQARVVRRIDRGRGIFLLDRGRTDGFFPGTRLATTDGNYVLQIAESQPAYALATLAHGDAESLSQSPWTGVRGYLPSTGQGSTLTTVGRVVLSPSMLAHPMLSTLADDEEVLSKSLRGVDGRPPLYQPLLASRAAAAISQSGHFRVMSPTGSLAPIKRAKSRINAALNLKQRDGDPLFYESLVLPDHVVTLYVTGPIHQYTDFIEHKAGRLNSSRKNSLWRLNGGLVLTGVDPQLTLAASTAGKAASGSELEWHALSGKPFMVPKSDHGRVIRECLLGSFRDTSNMTAAEALIPSAIANLTRNYDPVDVTGRVTDADEAEVEVEFFDPAVATIGETIDICAEIGKLPLEPEGGRVTTILRCVGRGRLAAQEGRKWYLDVIEWDDDIDPSTLSDMGAVVPLYGRNSLRTDPLRLGSLALAASVPPSHPLSETDAQLMLLAAASQHPELPIELPQYLKDRINEFHNVKFVEDVAYRNADSKIGAAQPATDARPPHILHLDVLTLAAPVIHREVHSTEKTLDIDCGLNLSLTDPDGRGACDNGQATVRKQKIVLADDYDGQIAGQIWLSDTLPKFMPFYRTKKMEQMP